MIGNACQRRYPPAQVWGAHLGCRSGAYRRGVTEARLAAIAADANVHAFATTRPSPDTTFARRWYGQDQGKDPGRRARRGRNDPHHLGFIKDKRLAAVTM